jgi:hypothetical protein
MRLVYIIATKKWVMWVLFAILGVQIFLRVDKSWINESLEYLPGGGIEHKYNYFDFRRLAGTMYLGIPIVAYVALKFKQRKLAAYGFIEIILGIAAGLFVLAKLDFTRASDWVSLATTVYLVVRGAENFQKGAELRGWHNAAR